MNKALRTRLRILIGIVVAASIVFFSTTIILAIGMMPTIAAAIVDKSKSKSKTLTVAAMNLAGCIPFILELWNEGHTIAVALQISMQAKNMIVMYLTAASGYVISYAVTGIVSSILLQKAKLRVTAIEKKQAALVDRWGQKVDGRIPLDQDGFPIEGDL